MVKTVFWALVLVLALSFFGISIRAIVMSPAGQENFTYIYQVLQTFWHWLQGWITL